MFAGVACHSRSVGGARFGEDPVDVALYGVGAQVELGSFRGYMPRRSLMTSSGPARQSTHQLRPGAFTSNRSVLSRHRSEVGPGYKGFPMSSRFPEQALRLLKD